MCENWGGEPVDPPKFAFASIVEQSTRILLLGSLPGEASLARGQYYAHPQNQFWRLVGDTLAQPEFSTMPYDDRLEILRAARIGLWDTVRSAQRRGSLDSAIRDPVLSPLTEFTAGLPELRAVGFNGAKAAAIGRKQLDGSAFALIDLPSSSPAFAGMPFGQKAARWTKLREFLP